MKARIALLVISLLIGFQSTHVHAAANLKQVQVSENSQVEIFFDSKIREDQVQVEYIRDIIQVTLSDVNVYPARVSSVTNSDLKKVFAYQYSPKTVRCRLSVEGNAEDYKNRFKLKLSGKTLSLKVSGKTSESASSKSAVPASVRDTGLIAEKEDKAPEPHLSESEKALLDKVMKQPSQPEKEKNDNKKIKTKKAASDELEISEEKSKIPSPLRTFAMLGVVIALFAASAFGVKKWRDRNAGASTSNAVPRGLKGMLTQALSQKLGKNKKLIEIVANHYLGPKKSISVVKIQGRTLVLGVSQDSINLIAQLPNDASADDIDLESFAQSSIGTMGTSAGASSSNAFSQMLASAAVATPTRSEPKISLGSGATSAASSSEPKKPRSSIRDRIRKEVENLKSV